MIENWDKAIALVLQHEGGYDNHPSDSGGRTNHGVMQKVWEDYVGHPVDEQEMRDLTIEMVTPLYKEQYWDACHCDELPQGIDYLTFDFAVNAGTGRAVKTLQRALKIEADGVIGPITLKALQDANAESFVNDFSNAKEGFYRSLSTFPIFGKGWLKRVVESKKTAEGMIV